MDEDKIQEKKEQEEAFNIFDNDKDGKLNSEELTYAFLCLGYSFSEDEIDSIINKFGSNNKITFESFSDYIFKRSKDAEMEEELWECFKEMDKDHDGKISKKDWKYLLYSIGEKLNDAEIEEIIRETDSTGDGVIYYKDMIRLLLTK